MVLRSLLFILMVLSIAGASAPPAQRESAPAPPELEVLDRELTHKAQQLGDWSEQHQILAGVIKNLWRKNKWNSEADRFARDTALRVERIPPWNFDERMDLLISTTKDRYHLDDRQVEQFQQRFYREMWGMTLKYAPVLMKNVNEMLDTRLRGEPFSAEQVADWAWQFDPLMKNFEQDVSRMVSEFGGTLTDQQRRIFDRDVRSLNKRMTHFTQSIESWKRGEWREEDWGLQDDPVHRPGYEKRMARETLNRMLDRRATNYDESTWQRYVRGFIDLHDLDDAQRRVCTAILDDVVARAERYRFGKIEEINKLNRRQRADHPLLAPIRMMFEELKSRLNLIPTESQRKQALEQAARSPRGRRSRGSNR